MKRGFAATDPPSHKGKTDSWLTPLWIINALGNDFDLDPCGFKNHRTAKNIIQLPENGLEIEWKGKVWLNPPYSEASKWIDRMVEHRSGSVLIYSRTGPLGKYIKDCDHLFFFRKRIRFLKPDLTPADYNPSADCMLMSWGSQDFSKLEGVLVK